MRIEIARPPLYANIHAVFPKKHGIIYCHGDTIYNPDAIHISAALQQHEETHSEQQGETPLWWWGEDIADPKFRYMQEAPANVQEFAWHKEHSNRRTRRSALKQISMRLSSNLYGNLCTRAAAERMIRLRTSNMLGSNKH